ncbi:unnamed protein product [Rangifer tarandus platyrhynchus]|uniref:Uncharacterized protein n=2 Tax=Rangifer tarandus platyrhynchus TaxID=3082113 RepID=A0AC60A590_RANTA|nr:unnamed protein product [Rangifer tarandus platyrhynchus]
MFPSPVGTQWLNTANGPSRGPALFPYPLLLSQSVPELNADAEVPPSPSLWCPRHLQALRDSHLQAKEAQDRPASTLPTGTCSAKDGHGEGAGPGTTRGGARLMGRGFGSKDGAKVTEWRPAWGHEAQALMARLWAGLHLAALTHTLRRLHAGPGDIRILSLTITAHGRSPADSVHSAAGETLSSSCGSFTRLGSAETLPQVL